VQRSRLPHCAEKRHTEVRECLCAVNDPFIYHHGVEQDGMPSAIGWLRLHVIDLVDNQI
jgi:hypothetical protein